MSKVNWGIPRIFVKDLDEDNANWYEQPTPIEDSTELTSTQGDKMEAKIEGGENEDVKYKRSTYELVYNIRMLKGRQSPFPIADGVVDHKFAVLLQPEDAECEGFYIESSTVSVDINYTAADGARWEVHHDALKAAKGDTVKWGKVSTTTTDGKLNISFTEGSSHDNYINGELIEAVNVASSEVKAEANKGGKPTTTT